MQKTLQEKLKSSEVLILPLYSALLKAEQDKVFKQEQAEKQAKEEKKEEEKKEEGEKKEEKKEEKKPEVKKKK